ncbi:hypothetical protein GCM10023185_05690 [Hymenobacter saemangeumensis]|uniref:T6SS immunity protein Tdi1 C-terminal domain-containing protein n=1 Tax=Hymenobacter saemangeumensis TaxID=1084522 RepID=A0ABP8I123_9BACT
MEDLSHYLIQTELVDTTKVLSTWNWLIQSDKAIAALTKMGDAVLIDNSNNLYHLDTGLGELYLLGQDRYQFLDGTLNPDVYEDILSLRLVDELEAANKYLETNQVYPFYQLPLMGGAYAADNIYCLDIYEHFGLTGEIHLQLSGLPDGTEVILKTE